MKTMRIKTKKRIMSALKLIGICFIVALIFFNFYLSVGVYGQMKNRQGVEFGLKICKRIPPDIKTSFTLPSGAIEAIHFAEPTHIGDK